MLSLEVDMVSCSPRIGDWVALLTVTIRLLEDVSQSASKIFSLHGLNHFLDTENRSYPTAQRLPDQSLKYLE
jgi:hypothetical protein